MQVSSGEKKIYRLSRRGNRRLNHAIHMAAVTQIHFAHSPGRDYYERKRAEGKRHNAAIICLARRRCNVILAMLRTGQPYQPTRPAPALTKAA